MSSTVHPSAPPLRCQADILALDARIGRVVAALQAQSATWAKTLVVFASDNGAAAG